MSQHNIVSTRWAPKSLKNEDEKSMSFLGQMHEQK